MKSSLYKDILKKTKIFDIREYTRECMRKYDNFKLSGFGLKFNKSHTLEDILIKMAKKFNTAGIKKHGRKRIRRYNLKAYKLIKDSCGDDDELSLNYYRFYTKAKQGKNVLDFNINYQEEAGPEIL
jgi:hypothetical protein